MKKLYLILALSAIASTFAYSEEFKRGEILALDLGLDYIQTTFDGEAAKLIYNHIQLPEEFIFSSANIAVKKTPTLQCYKEVKARSVNYNCKINFNRQGEYTGF